MAKKQTTLINGVAYSYCDMSMAISGINPAMYADGFNGIPIKSIDYSGTQQTTANYENSKFATSYSYGKFEYSGSVSFTLDSLEFLRDRIFELTGDDRSIMALPASDITLTFSNKGKINITTIKNVKFTTEATSGSEGDDTFAVTCDFIASYINYGDPSSLGVAAVTAAVASIATDDNQL